MENLFSSSRVGNVFLLPTKPVVFYRSQKAINGAWDAPTLASNGGFCCRSTHPTILKLLGKFSRFYVPDWNAYYCDVPALHLKKIWNEAGTL